MVNPEVISKRLRKLDEYLDILQRVRTYTYDEFISDPEHYGSAERFLQLAIETVSDIGSHIIADLALGEVAWHRDIPTILARENIIAPDMKDQWIRMIGFRNILVHDYLDIDRRAVFNALQNDLEDFRKLQRAFAKFL